MTTAHKPTWHSARGGTGQGGNVMVTPTRQYSSKDLPGHLELKTRHREQGSEYDGLSTDAFKRELIEREREYNNKKQNKGAAFDSTNNAFKMPKKRELKEAEKKDEELQSIAEEYKEKLAVNGTPFPQDADYESSESDRSEEKDSDDSDDSASEDDEDDAALLREYAKIKREREEQQRLKDEQKAREIEEKEKQEIMNDNPLYQEQEEEDEIGYSLKRKWYDETVFKNQSKVQKNVKKRFINDTVRSFLLLSKIII